MLCNQGYLTFMGAEIATSEPPTIRCKTCGKAWDVRLGSAGDILPDGCLRPGGRHRSVTRRSVSFRGEEW